MDEKTRQFQERVMDTLAAWQTQAATLRAEIDEMFRYHSGSPIVRDALVKCGRGIDEAISRLDGASLVLVILGLAQQQENPANGTQGIH